LLAKEGAQTQLDRRASLGVAGKGIDHIEHGICTPMKGAVYFGAKLTDIFSSNFLRVITP